MIYPLPPISNIAESTLASLPADLQISDHHAMLNCIQHGVTIAIFACCSAGGHCKKLRHNFSVLNERAAARDDGSQNPITPRSSSIDDDNITTIPISAHARLASSMNIIIDEYQ